MLIEHFLRLSPEEREQITEPLDFSYQLRPEQLGLSCDFPAGFCVALAECRQVPAINLSGNNISKKSLKDLSVALKTCKNLKTLILTKDSYGDRYDAQLLGEVISQCPTLEALDLSENNISSNLPYILKDCPQLKSLIIKDNKIPFNHDVNSHPISTILANLCPELRILDISENLYLVRECGSFIDANKNLYEIESSIWIYPSSLYHPMRNMHYITDEQIDILRNRYRQQLVNRMDEIATLTGMNEILASTTLAYDDSLPKPSYFNEEEIAKHAKADLKRLWRSRHALAMKKEWDLVKIRAAMVVSFVLAFALPSFLFPASWFIFVLKAVFATAMSRLVYKMYTDFCNSINDALQAAAAIPYDPIANFVYSEMGFTHGKESVKSWIPYRKLVKAKDELHDVEFNRYYRQWDRGELEGLIEVYDPAKSKRAGWRLF